MELNEMDGGTAMVDGVKMRIVLDELGRYSRHEPMDTKPKGKTKPAEPPKTEGGQAAGFKPPA